MGNSLDINASNAKWSFLGGNLHLERVICSYFIFVFLNVPLKPSLWERCAVDESSNKCPIILLPFII